MLGQHSSAQLLQNISTALPHVVKNIRENWDNVQSIHIKTSSSASLPIWSCGLDEEDGGRWDGLTRVSIPENMEQEVRKGKKRALDSEEEPGKKKNKTNTTAKKSLSSSPASISKHSKTVSAPSNGSELTLVATSTELPKGTKRISDPGSLTKSSAREPAKGKEKPARAVAVDFFGSGDLEDPPSPPTRSASKTLVSRGSTRLKPSPVSGDSDPAKSKSQSQKPLEIKTILKSSKEVSEPITADVPAMEKRVKFAAKPSSLKARRDKALGLTGQKVRSGGGKSASVKDGVLKKKVAVK